MTPKQYLHDLEDITLLKMCQELYDWKYISGKIDTYSAINDFANAINEWDLSKLETWILDEATKRYENIALLLIKNNPTDFFK